LLVQVSSHKTTTKSVCIVKACFSSNEGMQDRDSHLFLYSRKDGGSLTWFSNRGQNRTSVEVWIHILKILKACLNEKRQSFFLSISSGQRGIKYQTSRTEIRCFVCYSNKLRMITYTL